MDAKNLRDELKELEAERKAGARDNTGSALLERIADIEATIEENRQTEAIVAERELAEVGIEMKNDVPAMRTTTDLTRDEIVLEYGQLLKLLSGPLTPEYGWASWVCTQIENRKTQLAHLAIQKLSQKESKNGN